MFPCKELSLTCPPYNLGVLLPCLRRLGARRVGRLLRLVPDPRRSVSCNKDWQLAPLNWAVLLLAARRVHHPHQRRVCCSQPVPPWNPLPVARPVARPARAALAGCLACVGMTTPTPTAPLVVVVVVVVGGSKTKSRIGSCTTEASTRNDVTIRGSTTRRAN